MAGKGSTPRPCDQNAYGQNYERIFGHTEPRIPRRKAPPRPKKHDSKNLRSLSVGVPTDKIPQAMKKWGHLGVKYHPVTGEAIFRDRSHKLKCIKAMGFHDEQEVRG